MCLNLGINIDKGDRFRIIQNQVGGHCFKYLKEITRHQYRENFFNRSADLWNVLPNELVKSPTVKSRVGLFLYNFEIILIENVPISVFFALSRSD